MLEGNYFPSSHQVFATESSTLITIGYLTSFFILILLGKDALFQSCNHSASLFFFCPFIFYVLKTLIWRLEEQLRSRDMTSASMIFWTAFFFCYQFIRRGNSHASCLDLPRIGIPSPTKTRVKLSLSFHALINAENRVKKKRITIQFMVPHLLSNLYLSVLCN